MTAAASILDLADARARRAAWVESFCVCENCGHRWVLVHEPSDVAPTFCMRCETQSGEFVDERTFDRAGSTP